MIIYAILLQVLHLLAWLTILELTSYIGVGTLETLSAVKAVFGTLTVHLHKRTARSGVCQ